MDQGSLLRPHENIYIKIRLRTGVVWVFLPVSIRDSPLGNLLETLAVHTSDEVFNYLNQTKK